MTRDGLSLNAFSWNILLNNFLQYVFHCNLAKAEGI